MEILLGAAVVVVTTTVSWIVKKYGMKFGRAVTLVIAFVLCGVIALIQATVPGEYLQHLGTLFASQMAIYEIVWKTVLKPIFDGLVPPPAPPYDY